MVTTLLYLLFRKLRKYDWTQIKRQFVARLFSRSNQIIATLLILLLLASVVLVAQKQVRSYTIMRKGSEVGWTTVERKTDSNLTTLTMGTEVKVRFIFSFESKAQEVSTFRDGRLQQSYYYRKTNGSIKANRNMRLVGNNYEVDDKDKTRLNISPVTYNTLCMYFQEPVNIRKVYSDNHQRLLDIEKQPDGGYRIVSPDNTSNTFYYSSGICYWIKINHSSYSVELRLK